MAQTQQLIDYLSNDENFSKSVVSNNEYQILHCGLIEFDELLSKLEDGQNILYFKETFFKLLSDNQNEDQGPWFKIRTPLNFDTNAPNGKPEKFVYNYRLKGLGPSKK